MRIISVIGGSIIDKETYSLAQDLGSALASKGYAVACGGLSGVMEAVCRGASSAGGMTIGILPGSSGKDANPYVKIAVATGMGIGRNIVLVRTGEAVIAVDGREGTLSEMAMTLNLGKHLIVLNGMDLKDLGLANSDKLHYASGVDEAVNLLDEILP